MNAIIRYHYKKSPERLSNKKWAKLFNEYQYIKALELKNAEMVFKAALAEVLNAAFGGNN